jgi:hypothetical protein
VAFGSLNRNRTRSRRRFPGSDPEAPMLEEVHILREVYKEVGLPLWVIRKVCISLFKVIKMFMMKGGYVFINNFGAFVPFRTARGLMGTKAYDPTTTKIMYKFKISPVVRAHISDATKRRVKDAKRV